MQIKTTMRHPLTSKRMSKRLLSKSLQITNLGEDVEKSEPSYIFVGMQIGTATIANSIEVFQKTKNRTTVWSSNPTPGYISGKNEKHYFEKVHAPQCS